MALLELTLFATYYEQQIVNRWNYLSSGTPAAASLSVLLAQAFGLMADQSPPTTTTVFGAILSAQNVAVEYQEAVIRDVYSVTDFYTTPFVPAVVGAAAGEGNSPTLAFGFRTNRVRSDIARGMKRFVGVTEGASDPGGVIDTSYDATLLNIATLMADVIEADDEGNTITFTPAIVQKEQYDVPGSSPVRTAYRYYPTLAEQLEHVATGFAWQPYDTVRTQTSRQYGRGR